MGGNIVGALAENQRSALRIDPGLLELLCDGLQAERHDLEVVDVPALLLFEELPLVRTSERQVCPPQ